MAGSSNFKQWNPTAANQENDAAYDTDPQRTGGAPVDANFPSPTANKLFYQVTTFIAAFAQALANKGYNVSDADITALEAVLANIVTDADQRIPLQVGPFSPAPAFDPTTYAGFQMTLTGNVTTPTFSAAPVPGTLVAWIYIQDGVGGRTVAWPAGVNTSAQPNAAANSATAFLFIADSTNTLQPIFQSSTHVVDVTSTRGFADTTGTVYQNTGTQTKRVIVSGELTLSVGHQATIQARIGATNPPTLNVATSSITNSSGATSISFDVPPGFYYAVYTNLSFPGQSDPATLYSWVEYN